jgi:hypothetical protein
MLQLKKKIFDLIEAEGALAPSNAFKLSLRCSSLGKLTWELVMQVSAISKPY